MSFIRVLQLPSFGTYVGTVLVGKGDPCKVWRVCPRAKVIGASAVRPGRWGNALAWAQLHIVYLPPDSRCTLF
jgi:hypothetical protein